MNGRTLMWPVAVGLGFFALWEVVVTALRVKPVVLPPPTLIARGLRTRGPLIIEYNWATLIELVRGVLATGHAWLKPGLSDKDLWRAYRASYGSEPFVRIVHERGGIYRHPEPKLLAGTNLADVGWGVIFAPRSPIGPCIACLRCSRVRRGIRYWPWLMASGRPQNFAQSPR